jgi:hypothetical protein
MLAGYLPQGDFAGHDGVVSSSSKFELAGAIQRSLRAAMLAMAQDKSSAVCSCLLNRLIDYLHRAPSAI